MSRDIPMFEELSESKLELVFTRKGGTAHRRFYTTWDAALQYFPAPGTPLAYYPALRVDKVKIDGAGEPFITGIGDAGFTHAYVDVEYAMEYKDPHLGEPARVTFDVGVELLNTCIGRRWWKQELGDPAPPAIDIEDVAQAVPYSMDTAKMDMVVDSPPWDTIDSVKGKINSAEWDCKILDGEIRTVPAECSYCEGASVDGEYNYNEQKWCWRVSYKFSIKSRSWNEVWWTGQRQVDSNSPDGWAHDPETRAYIYAKPGDWVSPDPALYETADFGSIFG